MSGADMPVTRSVNRFWVSYNNSIGFFDYSYIATAHREISLPSIVGWDCDLAALHLASSNFSLYYVVDMNWIVFVVEMNLIEWN